MNKIASITAALHLPPFPASSNPDRKSMSEIRSFVMRNVEMIVNSGIESLILQDLGEHPVSKEIPVFVTAGISTVGTWVRDEFPDLEIGISLLGHGAKEPLAIANAIGAKFVRLKVFVGAMVKAEGVLEGCAADAIQYRHMINGEDIAIYADVYDRTGVPLGRLPLIEEARQAYVFGQADAIILTGSSFEGTMEMISEIRQNDGDIPLIVGGGVSEKNVVDALHKANGIIVSSAFKKESGFTRETIQMDWDTNKIKSFMNRVKNRN